VIFSKSKYIIVETPMPVPMVFSELQQHADVVYRMFPNCSVLGAGFCHIVDDKYVCYGESVSLNVKSRGEADSKVLNSLLGAANEG